MHSLSLTLSRHDRSSRKRQQDFRAKQLSVVRQTNVSQRQNSKCDTKLMRQDHSAAQIAPLHHARVGTCQDQRAASGTGCQELKLLKSTAMSDPYRACFFPSVLYMRARICAREIGETRHPGIKLTMYQSCVDCFPWPCRQP